jgi:MYXO-CTERM domain-containing protein
MRVVSVGRWSRRVKRALACVPVVGLATCGWTEPAFAYDQLPGYVQNIFALDCAPSCLLCHTRPEGGEEYIKPASGDYPDARGYGVFVQNLMASYRDITQGLPTEAQLATALAAMRTSPCSPTSMGAPCDSDGDTKNDVDELATGQDPDDGSQDAPLCIGPRYGCGARVAPAPPARAAHASAWLAALGVALILARRLRA